jgi:hypothetical protein
MTNDGGQLQGTRPSLLALQPTRLAIPLRQHGIIPRELAPQPPRLSPCRCGWGVLPPSPFPLLLDLVGMDLPLAAMLLTDLLMQQREQRTIPLLIIPTALTWKRLIASSTIASVIIDEDVPAETISRWVRAPIRLRSGQVWVGSAPPALPLLHPHLIPLLAAMSRATSVAQAAEWCYLARSTAYAILSKTCRLLDIAVDNHRTTAEWIAVLEALLAY